jgi:hypothetical protein
LASTLSRMPEVRREAPWAGTSMSRAGRYFDFRSIPATCWLCASCRKAISFPTARLASRSLGQLGYLRRPTGGLLFHHFLRNEALMRTMLQVTQEEWRPTRRTSPTCAKGDDCSGSKRPRAPPGEADDRRLRPPSARARRAGRAIAGPASSASRSAAGSCASTSGRCGVIWPAGCYQAWTGVRPIRTSIRPPSGMFVARLNSKPVVGRGGLEPPTSALSARRSTS